MTKKKPDAIPHDARLVAAVVVGGQQMKLTGPRMRDAIAAMHALGCTQHHIAERLRTTVNTVEQRAREMGRRFPARDPEPDLLAVEFVCQGTRMPLKGVDRAEAVRRLAGRYSAPEIAFLLLDDDPRRITALASRLGVSTRQPWTYSGRPTRQPQAA